MELEDLYQHANSETRTIVLAIANMLDRHPDECVTLLAMVGRRFGLLCQEEFEQAGMMVDNPSDIRGLLRANLFVMRRLLARVIEAIEVCEGVED